MSSDNNIDVVVLWVDGSNEKWINEYNKYSSAGNKKNKNRYRDWDTIKYVFRGIERFMPWVEKVHFITCGQKPDWMVSNHPKLNFVNHADIYTNNEHLPTFNSSSIELNIHRIDGLADRFIYFNDDMLVLKETCLDRFFVNDLPVDFLVETIPRRGKFYEFLRKSDSWASMINNSIRLINDNFDKKKLLDSNASYIFSKNYYLSDKLRNVLFQMLGRKYFAFKHYHHPQSYNLKTLKDAECLFPDSFNSTIGSRFRNKENVSQAIFRYLHLATGNFYPSSFNDHCCVNVNSEKSVKKCISAIKTYRFVCVNDMIEADNETTEKYRVGIIKAIDEILPNKSTFEI